MKNYLESFMELCSYPERDRKELLRAYDAISGNTDAKQTWSRLLEVYAADMNCDLNDLRERAIAPASALRLHPFTLDLLFFLCLTKQAKCYYEEKGLSEKIFLDSMLDLRYKLEECREVYGICGTFVGRWFLRFFNLTRFAFGRLQFELSALDADYDKGGHPLTSDSITINIHIPRTGTRMDEESCNASFAQAASFFKKDFADRPIVFRCHSWLLFPAHAEILPESSNIRKFAARFEYVKTGEYDDYNELWRLFDRVYPGTPDRLPYDTSLHRAYVDLIRAGKKTGWGLGIFFWDGE